MNLIRKILEHKFMRYGIMAVLVVSIELVAFWVMEGVFGWHYLIATWISLFIGIVLNWIGSRYFVFGRSKYAKSREFGLVAITSLFGIILQSGTVALMVEVLDGSALIGKVAAIVITFFWNYYIRERFIFKKTSNENI